MLDRGAAVESLVADIAASVAQMPAVACYADAAVERDLRLAAETLDDALTRLQVARHTHTRSLLDELDARR